MRTSEETIVPDLLHTMLKSKLFSLVLLIVLVMTGNDAQTNHSDEFFCQNDVVFSKHRHYTATGKTCLYWKDTSVTGPFPDGSAEAAENNCRDPTNDGTPWCFTSKNPERREDCDVPRCNNKDAVFMSPTECSTPRTRAGYKNGDVIPIYSHNTSDTTPDTAYGGCELRFESCKECKFHLKVDAELPPCNIPSQGNKCLEGCQMLSIRDGLYNETVVKVYSGVVTNVQNFHTISNVLIVQYCQLVNRDSQSPVKFSVTAFVTTKHLHMTATEGDIYSPNFPHGYFSEKETYMYSVDPPRAQLDANVTLLFYDWDLNKSAGSTVMVKWTEKLHNGSSAQRSKEYSTELYRPAMFIPASSFQIVFSTGRTEVESAYDSNGFRARYVHINKPNWVEIPDTQCGRYFSRSESIGGMLTYFRLAVPEHTPYISCIWVIPMPRTYTHLQYKVVQFVADPTVTLVFRDGVTSVDNVIQAREYIAQNAGLYVELSGYTSQKNVQLNVTYLASSKRYGECRSVDRILKFYCPALDVCIDQELYVSHAGPVCGLNTGPKPLTCPDYKCGDGSGCYTEVTKCNMVRDCRDGSDENVTICYPVNAARNVNLPLAISLPIVGVLFLVPIVVVIVCIVRQRQQELKDEELRASKDKLVTDETGAGATGPSRRSSAQGWDNLGMQMDEIPLSTVSRHPDARSGAPRDMEDGGFTAPKKPNPKFMEISADLHHGKSPYTPRGPGETQSMRVDPERGGPVGAPTSQSMRFQLPPDIDRIEELPEEPKHKYSLPYGRPQGPPTPLSSPPRAPKPSDDRRTLATFRTDERPYGDPEGRSYREYREPSYRERLPGDGSYLPNSPKMQEQPIIQPLNGARPKMYESKNPRTNEPNKYSKSSLSQYRPERDVPGSNDKYRQDRPPQTTQSYRVEPAKSDAPPRGSNSYRFQANDLSSTEV